VWKQLLVRFDDSDMQLFEVRVKKNIGTLDR